jgi:hypothetical protein
MELAPYDPTMLLTNYECVNEVHTSILEYCEATAVNKQDNYTLSDLGWNPTFIPFVGVWSYAIRDGVISGAAQNITTASTTQGAMGAAAGGHYFALFDVYFEDPDDSAAWTKAKVDGMEIGIEFLP